MSLISVKSQVKTECSLYLPWTAVDKEIYNDAKTTLWVSILAGVPIFKFEKYRSFDIPLVNTTFSVQNTN